MRTKHRTIEVSLEPLTTDSFAPFGRLIESLPRNPHVDQDTFHMVELPFSIDSTPDLRIAHYPVQDMCFAKFERHLTMTESRVALGQAVVLIVAADTPIDDRHTLPDARSVKALLMKGNQGIVFRRGTWHGLDCYPVNGRPADFVFLTEKEAEDELLEMSDVDAFHRSHIVDFADTRGIVFRVGDPLGLLPSVQLK